MSSDCRTESASNPSLGPSDVERTTARYVFTISTLSTGSDDRVTTGELHEYLDVAPASVTEMVAKLGERGLVDYEKYRGVRLTGQGRELATGIAWRLCVVTSFFDSVLDANLDEDTAFAPRRRRVSPPGTDTDVVSPGVPGGRGTTRPLRIVVDRHERNRENSYYSGTESYRIL